MYNFYKFHKKGLLLTFIMLVAMFSRLVFFNNEVAIISDSVIYAKAGENLIEHGRYEAFSRAETLFPPGFPIAVGIVNKLFHDPVFSLRIVSFVFGVLTVYLAYLAATALHSRKAGLFAAFFVALNPSLVAYSQEVFSDSMYLFFALAVFYAYLNLEKKQSIPLAIMLGALIGFSYLIKPEGILLLILPAVYFIKNIRADYFKALAVSLIVLVSSAAVISPYIYFLQKNTGQVMLTAKAYPNLVYGEILNGTERSRISKEDLVEYEKYEGNYNEEKNIPEFPQRYRSLNVISSFFEPEFSEKYANSLKSEMHSLWTDHGAEAVLLLFVIHLFFSFVKSSFAKRRTLLLLSVLPLFLFPLFHIESRYLLQSLIFIFLFASIMCAESGKVQADPVKIKNLKIYPLALLGNLAVIAVLVQFTMFIFSNVSSEYIDRNCKNPVCTKDLTVRERVFPGHMKDQDPSFLEYKIAGEFVKNDAQNKKTVIMSRRRFEVSFYAGTDNSGIMLPYTSAENILRFAQENKVDYIVVDERFLSIRENYGELRSLNSFSGGISLVFEDNSVNPIRIFKLKR